MDFIVVRLCRRVRLIVQQSTTSSSLRSIFAVVAAFSFAAGCDRPQTRPVLAQVLEIRGDAFTVSDSNSAARTALRADSMIDVGHTITTSDNAAAIIALVPGIVVQLNPNTSVSVEELLLTKSSRTTFFVMESRTAHIKLLRGSIDASVISTITDTEFTIDLPGATVVASQTSSAHLVAVPDIARVTVAEGEVKIQRKQAAAANALNAECFQQWAGSTGAESSEPSPVDADENAKQEFEQACDAQRRFADLLSNAAHRLPAW